MTDRDRQLIRYGIAGVAVTVGALCAAALTNSLGNTLATVLIGGGLVAIVIMLLRDMGVVATSGKPETPSSSRNGSEPHHGPPPAGEPPQQPSPHSARRTVSVRRPDRMRGQRRRLR